MRCWIGCAAVDYVAVWTGSFGQINCADDVADMYVVLYAEVLLGWTRRGLGNCNSHRPAAAAEQQQQKDGEDGTCSPA